MSQKTHETYRHEICDILFFFSFLKIEFDFSWELSVNLFLCENIRCGNSKEVPLQGASNEFPEHMFLWKNKENIMWLWDL